MQAVGGRQKVAAAPVGLKHIKAEEEAPSWAAGQGHDGYGVHTGTQDRTCRPGKEESAQRRGMQGRMRLIRLMHLLVTAANGGSCCGAYWAAGAAGL